MKTLDSFKFKGKKVLLRADLDSDVKNGRVFESGRIKEASLTIKDLKRKGAKVVVLAHQSRPGKKDFIGLKQHAKLLNKYVRVKFVNNVIGNKSRSAINGLKNGEVILLDNVRKIKDEFENKGKLVRFFKDFDIYVNDAFATSHRSQASIVGFKEMKRCAGLALEKELKALKKIKTKKGLFILGGAKPEDNVKLLGKNKVLAVGFFGQLCLIASGKRFGAQNKFIKNQLFVIPELKKKLKNVMTPEDFAVSVNGKRKELFLDEFPNNYIIDDIGSKTVDNFIGEIKKAKAVFMKGPAGDCGNKGFCKGTISLLKAVSKIKGFTLIGGGHLSDAVAKSGISAGKFGHVSLAGGALIAYVAGENLPGLEVLK